MRKHSRKRKASVEVYLKDKGQAETWKQYAVSKGMSTSGMVQSVVDGHINTGVEDAPEYRELFTRVTEANERTKSLADEVDRGNRIIATYAEEIKEHRRARAALANPDSGSLSMARRTVDLLRARGTMPAQELLEEFKIGFGQADELREMQRMRDLLEEWGLVQTLPGGEIQWLG